MAGKQLGIEVPDLKETLRALNQLPKAASVAMREESHKIAADEVPRLQSAGRSGSRQAQLVAPHIRVKRDRVPAILAGGTKNVTPSRKVYRSTTNLTKSGRGKLVKPKASQIFFGAEFGGGYKHSKSGKPRGSTAQFPPHRGKQGYWFWPQLRRDQQRMILAYGSAIDRVLNTEWED